MLSLSVLYVARLLLGLRLPDLPYTVPRAYIALSGGAWGAIGCAGTIGLFRGLPWAPRLTRVGAVLFAAWYWLDRVLFVHTEYALRSWPGAAVLTLAAVGFTFWALSRPHVRHYFGRSLDERRVQD